MAEVEVIDNPKKKPREVPRLIPHTEVDPVIRLLMNDVPLPVIQRRRERPLRFIGRCIVRRIQDLESENRALRELTEGKGELIARPLHRRGLESVAA